MTANARGVGGLDGAWWRRWAGCEGDVRASSGDWVMDEGGVLGDRDRRLGALGFQTGRLCGRVPAGLEIEIEIEAAVLWSGCGWLAGELNDGFGIWWS
jgi:hypothetical protein